MFASQKGLVGVISELGKLRRELRLCKKKAPPELLSICKISHEAHLRESPLGNCLTTGYTSQRIHVFEQVRTPKLWTCGAKALCWWPCLRSEASKLFSAVLPAPLLSGRPQLIWSMHSHSPPSPTELFCFVFMINLGILKMVCNGISGMQPHHITWYPLKGGAGGRAWLLHKDWEVIFIQETTEVESQGSCLSCGSPRGDMNRFSSFTVCWAQKSVSEDTRKHFRNPQFSLAP